VQKIENIWAILSYPYVNEGVSLKHLVVNMNELIYKLQTLKKNFTKRVGYFENLFH
jgi:hypothetical protein